MDIREEETCVQNDELEEEIRDKHAPSLKGGLRTAGIAAGVSAGFTLVASTATKYLKERRPG